MSFVIIHDNRNAARPPSPNFKPTLIGRKIECARIDGLLQHVRAGGGGVLVLRGEHGIGKTLLLDEAERRAEGFRVIRIRGIESETDLPYAGLHLLTSALADCLGRLAPVEREALEGAVGFGRAKPDRFVVGLATAALLSGANPTQPLLCIVDDAQWLDQPSAQALAFVGRRITRGSVAILLAEREQHQLREFDGLPEIQIPGLSPTETRKLLQAVIRGRADETVDRSDRHRDEGKPACAP